MKSEQVKIGMKVWYQGQKDDKRGPAVVTRMDESERPIEIEFKGREWFYPYRAWVHPVDLEEAE